MVDDLRALIRDKSWLEALSDEFDKPYMSKLANFLDQQARQGVNILPPQRDWFTALNNTPLERVKVVILGQDPYPTSGHAHGLCFSVSPGVKPLPKSLVNIYKELHDDIGIDNSHSGYLLPWAHQGVLMLNAVLTVEEGKSNAHVGIGWERLTDAIIDIVNTNHENIVFVLWGANAQKKASMIDAHKHHIITSPHPSPLSAYRGFWGSKPFSRVNTYLETHLIAAIDWRL